MILGLYLHLDTWCICIAIMHIIIIMHAPFAPGCINVFTKQTNLLFLSYMQTQHCSLPITVWFFLLSNLCRLLIMNWIWVQITKRFYGWNMVPAAILAIAIPVKIWAKWELGKCSHTRWFGANPLWNLVEWDAQFRMIYNRLLKHLVKPTHQLRATSQRNGRSP